MNITPDGAFASGTQAERRLRRSADPEVALALMLDGARRSAGIEALAISDLSGCLVAASGAARACEELAAVAPLLGDDDAANDVVPTRLEVLAREQTEVRRLCIDGFDVLLAAHGSGEARAASLLRAAEGCRRILSVSP
jgi:hypothetical protein